MNALSTSRWSRWLAWTVCVCLVAAPLGLPGRAEAAYGRTEGGYAGTLLGALGGASLGSAIVGAAGIANPLLATGVLATTTVGTGLAGAKVGSWLGNEADEKFGAEKIWTVVGAVTGGLLGVAFGPGGSVLGKIVGGAVGAVAGGWIARKLSGKADADFNPRTVGALIGGVNGALIGGPVGAAVGTVGGYVGGNLFDKYIFVKSGDGETEGDDGDDRSVWERLKDRWRSTWSDAGDGYDREGYDYDGFNRDGYDRMGFDADGFDAAGYDRMGFDRDGYDDEGLNREGYDRAGVRREVRDPYANEGATYDAEIYNRWWDAYGRCGGAYPRFDEGHWDAFTPEMRRDMQAQYGHKYRADLKDAIANASDELREELQDVRERYRDAVRDLRDLAAEKGAEAEREAALAKVKELQSRLDALIRQATGE